MNPKRAFTLIELLVVIGIIAILAAITIPGLSTARERANRAKCAGNLKQIGMAIESYLGDHNRLFPEASVWNRFGEIAALYLPYLENNPALLKCPSQKNDLSAIFPTEMTLPDGKGWMTYEFSNAIRNKRFVPSFITEPVRCAYVWDYPYEPGKPYLPHKNGMNVLYLDWHVSWLPVSEYFLGTPQVFYAQGHM